MSGTRVERARRRPSATTVRHLFAHSNTAQPGFMQIDFLKDGRVRLSVIEYGGKDLPPYEMYSTFLAKPDARTAKVTR